MTSPSVLSNRPAALDTRAILDAVDTVLVDAARPVELHEPRFGARERELVLDCIDTGWVSTAGKYVDAIRADGCRGDAASAMPSPSSTVPRRCTPRCCWRASSRTTR